MNSSSKKRGMSLLAMLLCLAAFGNTARAQQDTTFNQMVIPPLFEYVIAPEELPDLRSRTDYLMDNFWNPFDFKKSGVVDQNALNHAFGVYVESMRFASEKKVKESVKKLIANLKGNPALSYQFTKAAEESLYGPRADFWADEIYMSFLKNLLENKKIDDNKKKKYKEQYDLLTSTAIGAEMPQFELNNAHGTSTSLNPSREAALICFTTPNSEDGKYSLLKMDISGVVNDMIEDGRLDVYVVILGDTFPEVYMPDKWTVLQSGNATDVMDIRFVPCFYILDGKKKIAGKNLAVDDAIDLLEMLYSKGV